VVRASGALAGLVGVALVGGVAQAPHAHLRNLKEEDFSRDPVFVEKLKADSLGNQIPGTAQLLAELIRADERLKQSFSQIRVPAPWAPARRRMSWPWLRSGRAPKIS
jgi:hypothetical protein